MLLSKSILFQAVIAGVATMLATGLGAIPVLFTQHLDEKLIGAGYALAGGMMVSVSLFDLLGTGLDRGQPWELALGFLLGSLAFWLGHRYLEEREDTGISGLQGAGADRAILILSTMFIHSFPEGVAVGVGYATGDIRLGLFVALAIAIHNIPEGLAISLPLSGEGIGFWRCVWYSVLSSAPQPIAVVPAVLLISISVEFLPVSMGFAAGAMTYLVIAELLPESLDISGKHLTAWSFTVGFVAMVLTQHGL